MIDLPEFPKFKAVELEDRRLFQEVLRLYEPDTSELTFTNLFIWRSHYRFEWTMWKNWLLVLCSEGEDDVCALMPLGPSPRDEVSRVLLEWMGAEKGTEHPRIVRADERLVSELAGSGDISVEATRDHFDYVYLRDDLAELKGNRYRSKRNHINQLFRSYRYEYLSLDRGAHIEDCIKVQEKWCGQRRCEDDLDLIGEWEAVRVIRGSYESLELQGGVLIIDGKVAAFTIGEMLNAETAVVHIEKADPDIPGLYPAINQQFCINNWKGVRYINREQELGVPGLREAKLSYDPHHLVQKFRITLNR